ARLAVVGCRSAFAWTGDCWWSYNCSHSVKHYYSNQETAVYEGQRTRTRDNSLLRKFELSQAFLLLQGACLRSSFALMLMRMLS
ncbi:hypothetical protein DVH24_038680, partial [Malus domestica]